jgi:hypothetical protein
MYANTIFFFQTLMEQAHINTLQINILKLPITPQTHFSQYFFLIT